MNKRPTFSSLAIAAALALSAIATPFSPPRPALAETLPAVDDFETGLPSGIDPNGIGIGFVTFNDPNSTVAITTTQTPPAPVPGAAAGNTVARMNVSVVSYAGFVHAFENAGVSAWVSQDWSPYEGLSFWLHGNGSGTTLFVDILDNRNPGSTRDDAERWSADVPDNFSGWREIKIPFASMRRKEIGNGAPNDGFGLTEAHGWAIGAITTPSQQAYYIDRVAVYGTAPIRPLTAGFDSINYRAFEGSPATLTVKLSKSSPEPVTVRYATTFGQAIPYRDYVPVSGTLIFPPNVTRQSFTVDTINDTKHQGERGVVVELSDPTGGAALGQPPIARLIVADDEPYDPALLDDFETFPYLWRADKKASLDNPEIAAGSPLALPGQGAYERVLRAAQDNGKGAFGFSRSFPIGQDWRDSSGLNFMYYGLKSGKLVTVELTAPRAGPAPKPRMQLAWSDEFSGPAGAPADPSAWGQEVGDGTANGIPGWGNDELEFYTAGAANAATDGNGYLRIMTKQADGGQMCYYGPCQYTSARLLTKNRFETAYGRIEARVKVPRGAGLWPAFWMLGTDIDQVGWPQTGEIDIMEHVGRAPDEVFGTLHGPGYSGGQSYGRVLDLGRPVADDFHVFAVDWQPDRIVWSLDGTPYFTATPDDPFMQGKQWVFNHPFFLLLNVAVGGNFGGAVGPETVFPQTTVVDYVRVYQAEPALTTYAASFDDNFSGWQRISLPFSAFRGPKGEAADVSSVRSMGFSMLGGMRQPVMLDQIRLTCPTTVTVTSAADSGPGSLRQALGRVCLGGTVLFAPALAGATISLPSGPIALGRNVTIDGAAAPGLRLSGNNANRVVIVNAGVTAAIRNLTLADGYGFQLAGGVLNNGTLTLDRVVVTGNTMATDAGQFWQGGGGIYVGDGATLNLVDSAVLNNTARWSGGGVYAFFNSTTTIVRSTIAGNQSGDVGGGIRSLGNMSIVNSTLSGNQSTGWHGGAIFHTDGAMSIASSTIANNSGPDWAPSTIFLGSYSAAVPTLSLINTLITGNRWYACEWNTAGTVVLTSGGHNLVQDGSCRPVASDLIVEDAGVGPLANNGGPTPTHALLPGSPAINAGNNALCPATDQRGVSRPQGAACDIGAFELAGP